MEKGVAKGIGIGEERGENKATLNAIRNVMNSFKAVSYTHLVST